MVVVGGNFDDDPPTVIVIMLFAHLEIFFVLTCPRIIMISIIHAVLFDDYWH